MMNTTQENSELNYLKSLKQKTIKIFGPPGTGKTYTLIERVLKGTPKKWCAATTDSLLIIYKQSS